MVRKAGGGKGKEKRPEIGGMNEDEMYRSYGCLP